MKAFIFDPLWDDLITDDLQAQLDESALDVVVTKTIAPLAECAALFEGDEERILCINPDYAGWKLGADDYRDIPGLRAILPASTAFGWIDTTVADTRDIAVCNVRGFCTEAVAEWAVTMMCNLARQLPRIINDGFPLDFDADYMKYRGIELHGKTMGIVGLGAIGSAIADRAQGLGMDVIYWNRSPKNSAHRAVELPELFATADVVVLAMARNDETATLVTPELLASMPATAMLLTVGDELVDDHVVLEMVRDGRLYGFGFEGKPGTFASYEGNVWAAPAYAWATDGSMHNSMVKWIANMIDASEGRFPNRINA